MAGLLYYLPGADCSVTLQTARESGLGYAFDRKPISRGVHGGPDGRQGAILADPSEDVGNIGYHPDRQTWRQVAGTDAWVGRYVDQPVRPEDLQREKLLDGHLVELLDGQQWLCPIGRGVVEEEGELRWYCGLPRSLGKDEQGHWVPGAVRSQYAKLWDVTERWWQTWSWDDTNKVARPEFGQQEMADAAVLALSTNYRLGDAEVLLLELFDCNWQLTETVMAKVLLALVDWPTYLADLKKKAAHVSASDGSPTDVGPQDSIEATAQP
jgi:hypothetical protein